MKNEVYPRCINVKWRWEGEDEDFIIYQHPVTGLLDILNPVASQIFINCNGKNSIEDIANIILSEFQGSNKDTVINDINLFTKHMMNEDIMFLTAS